MSERARNAKGLYGLSMPIDPPVHGFCLESRLHFVQLEMGSFIDLRARFGGRTQELLADEFLGDAMSVVDLHERFHDSVNVRRDGARCVAPEHEVVVQ